MNVAIQLFSFDLTRKALNQISFLEAILKDSRRARFVWFEHDGQKRTASVESILENTAIRLNECYAQVSVRQVKAELVALGLKEITIHLSISPNGAIWDATTQLTPSGKPTVRKFVSYAQSLERAAAFRKKDLMPTVLEITLGFASDDVETLAKDIFDLIERSWSRIGCAYRFGTVDLGGEWLFFPKSGYNPNIADIHVFYSPEAYSSWQTWREMHNISFSCENPSESNGMPKGIIHILELRQPAHNQT